MTLARQLRVLFAALAVVVFVTVSLAGIRSSRQVLEADLTLQTRAAAQSLADRVAADPSSVRVVVEEAVARHDLRALRVALAGQSPVEQLAATRPATTPGWFAVLFPLASIEISVPVGQGGTLVATADPGPATQRLWHAALDALLPGAGTALTVLVVGLLAVGPLVRPLRQAEAEAEAALAWEVVDDSGAPAGPAIAPMQAAVRQLSRRSHLLLEGAQGLAATLHARASHDPLTGLASRRRLLDVLEDRRRDPEQAWTGALLIVRVEGIKAINETFGYGGGDDALRECARLLEETFGAEPGAVLAHLAGGEFGAFVPCASPDLLGNRVAAAEQALASLESRLRFPSSLSIFIGGAHFHGQGISALLAEADRSLRKAQWQGIPGLPAGAAEPARPGDHDLAARQGKAVAALDVGGLRLVLQPVLACETRDVRHHEAYARILAVDGSEPLAIRELTSGGDPAVVVAIDRAAIREALRLLGAGAVHGELSVNVSPASLVAAATADWLEAQCREHPEAARHLVVELHDAQLPRVMDRLPALLARLRPCGLRFAVDHFGAGPASFGHLRTLTPSYVKVDGSFAARLDRDVEAQCFVRAAAQIAHGLGIPAYLEGVESEAVWSLLSELQLDGAQGYHLGRPRATE